MLALGAVAYVLLGGTSSYQVKARFENASQLVPGNLVQEAGLEVGKISDIELSPDGQAEVTLNLDEKYAPLREGTRAVVRQASLSSVSGRYVDLQLPPGQPRTIPEGGRIPATSTTSAVDIDQIFDIFGPKERKALQQVLQGSNTQIKGKSQQLNEGLRYLDPALASTNRLMSVIGRDKPLLERFVVSSSGLVSDLASRKDDLSGVVSNLATSLNAIGSRRTELGDAVDQLPGFLRQANTTFANLRGTLDRLDPLVAESKPVTPKLRALLADLRPFARDARPTLRDLSDVVGRPGANNDLIELTRAAVPLRQIAVGPVTRNGKSRPGALPVGADALRGGTPIAAFVRPYSPDLGAWFDDFSHSGIYDAFGALSRAAPQFARGGGTQAERGAAFDKAAARGQNNRCPGSAEHGGAFKPTPDFPCDISQVPPGK